MKRKRTEPQLDFESDLVEVSVSASYLGLNGNGSLAESHIDQLKYSLLSVGVGYDRYGMIDKASSGMPQAIVPFRRPGLDSCLAACFMLESRRACFRGLGNALDAGYFLRSEKGLEYIDSVVDTHVAATEVLDPVLTQELHRIFAQWIDHPSVEVADPAGGAFLRLHPAIEALASLRAERPARLADKPIQAQVSLLRVQSPVEPFQPGLSTPPAVLRLAAAKLPVEREGGSLLLRQAPANFLMQAHAASLSHEDPCPHLFLHIELPGSLLLAPLPRLMQAGDCVRAWWAPLRDIAIALGGPESLTTHVRRSTAMAMMSATPWMWCLDAAEWARWAWWLGRQGLSFQSTPAEHEALTTDLGA
jgi:hypothetical protein